MTTPILRTSERRAFKRCQRRWWWGWREGLKPVGAESTPLWFGTGIHLGLAEWYLPGMSKRSGVNRGPHPAETFEAFAGDAMRSVKVATATEERVAQYEDGSRLGVILLEEYVKHWGRDESWSFIQAEKTFSLDIPWPGADRQSLYVVDEQTGSLVQYKGTYDGVYRDLVDGRIKLLETKSAKAIQLTHLTLDDQAGSYWAVASHTLRAEGLIKPDESIAGINYNFLRKALPDDRPTDAEGYACNKPKKEDYTKTFAGWGSTADYSKFTLANLEAEAKSRKLTVLGERSKVQPSPLFVRELVHRTRPERQTQLRRIQDEAVQMQAIRDGLLPMTKNPNRDCSWDCDFFGICELEERQGDWRALAKIAYRVEDPYSDHRKSAEDAV